MYLAEKDKNFIFLKNLLSLKMYPHFLNTFALAKKGSPLENSTLILEKNSPFSCQDGFFLNEKISSLK